MIEYFATIPPRRKTKRKPKPKKLTGKKLLEAALKAMGDVRPGDEKPF